MPLVLAATPIGNLGDAAPRLRAVLAGADVIAAEDTRRLKRLTAALDLAPRARVVSYYDAVERARTPMLLRELRAGRTVVLVTDAGMPLVSDPGHRLVTAAVDAGVPVTVVPGPSAALAALTVSGFATGRWAFEGFLPRKPGERRARLAQLAADPRTLVLFEAPHRLHAVLTSLAEAFGSDRPAVVCRELTKVHEEVRRGTLTELADWARAGVRGEVTIVVAGAPSRPATVDADELSSAVGELVADGMTRRDAVDAVAARHGLSRRVVYAAVSRRST